MKKLLTILCLLLIVNTHAQETICLVESCDEHFDYAMWLDDVLTNLQTQAGSNASKAKHYTATGNFTENGNGTALLSLNAINLFDANVKFAVTVNFSGKATNLSWQTHGCDYTATTTGWYGYSSFSGTLTGSGSLAGGKLSLTQKMGLPLQVGKGASLRTNTGKSASTWFMLSVVTQPTSLGSNQKYKLFPGNGDFNFCTNGSTKLSVKLTDFTAHQTPTGEVMVAWKAANETNFQQYVLERSTTLKDWHVVTNMQPNPRMDYQYLDREKKIVSVVYYRLVIQNTNKTETPTAPISVPLVIPGTHVYPNPVMPGESINVFSQAAESASLFTIEGKKVGDFSLYKGASKVFLQNTGMYLLRFDNGEVKKIQVN